MGVEPTNIYQSNIKNHLSMGIEPKALSLLVGGVKNSVCSQMLATTRDMVSNFRPLE